MRSCANFCFAGGLWLLHAAEVALWTVFVYWETAGACVARKSGAVSVGDTGDGSRLLLVAIKVEESSLKER
jgi:hypothetical protein